jgi:hypothetical protein
MLIFWKQRLVFLAVPKTGTTAWARALGPHADIVVNDPPELKHAPVYRYNRFFRPLFANLMQTEMEVMAVVREPVSWLGSWYRYRQRPFLAGRPTSTEGLSFDQFVEAYLRGQRPEFANVGSQSKFVERQPNGQGVDHLFRYENAARTIAFLEDRLGVTLDLPLENVSPRVDLDLSPDLAERLRRKCADDFALWDSTA